MPVPSEYRDIIEALHRATEDRRVLWTESGGSFTVRFPTFLLSIHGGFDEEVQRPFVAMAIQELDGKTVDNWYVEPRDTDFELLENLKAAASRSARKVDEKLDVLRKHLQGEGIIGL